MKYLELRAIIWCSKDIFEECFSQFGHNVVVSGRRDGLDGIQHRVVQLLHAGRLFQKLYLKVSNLEFICLTNIAFNNHFTTQGIINNYQGMKFPDMK